MCLLRYLLPLFLLSAHFNLSANEIPKFGTVTDEEWALKTCEFDEEASAVYLHCKGEMTITYGHSYSYEIYERIKILDKAGLEHARLTIFLRKHFDESVSSFKGYVHKKSLEGKVSRIRVSKKDLFNVEISDDYEEERIEFPAVNVGDIIEYRYTILTQNFVFPPAWHFQRELPVMVSNFNLLIQEGLTYKYFINGSRLKNLKKGDGKGNEFILENIPSYNRREFVYNAKKYQDILRLQLDSYYDYNATPYNLGGTQDVASDWKSIVNNSAISSSITPYLKAGKKPRDVRKSEKKIIDSLYNYLSNTFTWNGDYRLFPDQSLKKFEDQKTGSSAEINLYLCGLLRTNGIEADPVWSSTRSYGQPLKSFPLISQFNHVMVNVKSEGKERIISGINKNYPIDYLNVEENNVLGFLINTKDLRWIDIPEPKNNYENLRVMGIIGDETVTIKGEASLLGLPALELLKSRPDPNDKNPTTGLTPLIIAEGAQPEWENQGVVKFAMPEIKHEHTGDIIYLRSIPLPFFEKNPYVEEQRVIPIEIPYPVRRTFSFSMAIPENYVLEEIPPQVGLILPNKKGKFIYNFTQNSNEINIFCQLEFNSQLFTPQEYPYLKTLIDKVIEKQNTYFVLTSKN